MSGTAPRRWPLAAGGLALAVAALGFVAWKDLDARRVRAAVARADADLAAGRHAAARDRLAWLAAKRPGDPEFRFQLGVCEQALGRPDAALAAWSSVPAGSARSPQAVALRARTLIHSFGRLAEADALLDSALSARGAMSADAFWTRVELLIWEDRLAEARRLLEQGWKRVPEAQRVALLREHWRLDHVDVTEDEVRPVLAAAEEFAPRDPHAALLLAAVALRYGRYPEAAAAIEKSLADRPDDPAAWSLRLALARAADQPAAAADAVRRLPADRFGPREVLALRAWFATHRGDLATERRALDQLAALDPGDTTALDRLTDLARRAGDTARAVTLRDRQAEASRAKEAYRWGVIRVPDQPTRDQAVQLAGLAASLGRDFEAEGWWTLALAATPGDPAVLRALADLFARRGSPAPADAGHDALLADLARTTPTAAPAAPAAPARTAGLRFTDDAHAAGLDFTYESPPTPQCQVPEVMGGGAALLDFDGDGRLDVFVVQAGAFPPASPFGPSRDRLYRNKGDGTFEDVSNRSGIAGLPGGYGFAVAAADYDGDGRTDLFLSRWGSYALWRNAGGRFEDVTEKSGLGGDRGWPTSAAFADLDGDGDLDLYVCHYLKWDAAHPTICTSAQNPGRVVSCLPRAFPSEPDRLYRNDGGRFVDVSDAAGVTAADRDGRGLGVVAADLDGDGKVDLYVTNDQSANFLFRNKGAMRFEEEGFLSGTACAGDGVFRAGMGVACGDVDGDGRPDLAVTNFFGESTSLFRNLGDGLFADHSGPSGLAAPSHFRLGFGAAFFDANNDGHLDLATANGHVNDERPGTPYQMPPSLYLGEAGRFVDAGPQAGPPWSRPLIARGLAAGDLDNDGRVDVLVVPQNEPLVFAHNSSDAGHALTLRLAGAAPNRDAVGARVRVTAGGRTLTAWRTGGGSYASASDPRLHFGLGRSARADAVEVTWPSGRVDRFSGLAAGSGYLLTEGAARPEPLPGFARGTASGKK